MINFTNGHKIETIQNVRLSGLNPMAVVELFKITKHSRGTSTESRYEDKR